MPRQGGFGNQLFQYAALRERVGPTDRVALVGWTELKSMVDRPDRRFLMLPDRPWTPANRLTRRLMRVAPRLERLNVGLVKESPDGSHLDVTLGRVMFVEGFFQSGKADSVGIPHRMALKREQVVKGHQLLESMGVPVERAFFVHARSTDYDSWPSRDFPAVLTLDWYRRAVNRLVSTSDLRHAVIFSDDSELARELGRELRTPFVAAQDWQSTFAAMTLLPGGVLSASSFSWWGAALSRDRYAKTYFVGPRYWGGVRMGHHFPVHMSTPWIDELSL